MFLQFLIIFVVTMFISIVWVYLIDKNPKGDDDETPFP